MDCREVTVHFPTYRQGTKRTQMVKEENHLSSLSPLASRKMNGNE